VEGSWLAQGEESSTYHAAMSERPSWKKPPKPTTDEVVEQRTKDLVAHDRTPSLGGRAMRRGGISGTKRSVIYTFKMAIPKTRRKKR
jgi:hypothetical protein